VDSIIISKLNVKSKGKLKRKFKGAKVVLLKLGNIFIVFLIALITGFHAMPAIAQQGQDSYEDFGAFTGDPVELEMEVNEIFGRYFQANFQLGTHILTGGLGTAYSPSFGGNAKFIFFFDKVWAAELGAGFAQHTGKYTESNTKTANIDLFLTMNTVPFYVGLRYGFDQERLARGLATMNPYLAFNGEIVFRSEASPTSPIPVTDGLGDLASKYAAGAVVASTGFGFNVGGGIEFDVYRKRLFLGIDLRYHLIFWSTGNEFFGELDRRGNYISFMGGATYNY